MTEELTESPRTTYTAQELEEIVRCAIILVRDIRDTGECFDQWKWEQLWKALRLCPECEEVRLDDDRVLNDMKCGGCAR